MALLNEVREKKRLKAEKALRREEKKGNKAKKIRDTGYSFDGDRFFKNKTEALDWANKAHRVLINMMRGKSMLLKSRWVGVWWVWVGFGVLCVCNMIGSLI